MIDFNLSGAISIEGSKHTLEYDHEGFQSSTVFLRLNGEGPHNTPVFRNEIDEVIEMLRRGKNAIEALEPRGHKQ